MGQTQREKNEALVLEAFDTLFKKLDYARAETVWSLSGMAQPRSPLELRFCAAEVIKFKREDLLGWRGV